MASTMKTNSYTYGLSEYCSTAVYLLYVYKGFYSKLNRKCCHENHELSRCLQNKGLPCDQRESNFFWKSNISSLLYLGSNHRSTGIHYKIFEQRWNQQYF